MFTKSGRYYRSCDVCDVELVIAGRPGDYTPIYCDEHAKNLDYNSFYFVVGVTHEQYAQANHAPNTTT